MPKEAIKVSKPYTQMVYDINKNTIKNFVRPKWHRDFREKHVVEIKSSLLKKVHFSEPITVNSIEGEYTVINGNHRTEAIRRILKENPNFTIQCTLTKYDNLNEEEEHDLYEIINNIKPETRLDRIKAHCIESYIIKALLKDFPCRVVFHNVSGSERNAVGVSKLLEPYICRNRERVVGDVKTDDFVEAVKKMNEEDYERLTKFVRWFKKTFGEPGRHNQYSDYNFFSVIAKIYFTEVSILGEEELEKRCREMQQKFAAKVNTMFGYGKGYKQIEFMYNDVVNMLNMCRSPGRSKNVFNLIEAIREQKAKKSAKKAETVMQRMVDE